MRTNLLVVSMLCACGTGISPSLTEPQRERPARSSPLVSSCDHPLVASTSREVLLVKADGTHVTLFSAPASSQAWVSEPQVRGRFVAVTIGEQKDGTWQSRLELFDAEGNALASVDGAGNGYLSSRGHFASWTENGGVLVVSPDGTTKTIDAVSPAGAFGPGSTLPVWTTGTTDRALALLDVESGAVTPLPVPLNGWSSPIWSGDALVYIGKTDASLVLVRQTGATTATTPFTPSGLDQGLAVEQVAGSTAILVTGSWVQVRSKLDLETGVLSPFEVAVPEGATFAGRHSASLADDGSLIAAFAVNGAAGLWQSRDGASWRPMGGTVQGASWVQYAGKSGSWLMSAMTSAGAISASTMVGLIPAMGVAQQLPAFAAGTALSADALSADGRCAAVWSKTALTTVDLVSGKQKQLVEAGGDGQPMAAVWLEAR